jgi:hypothetical protein
LQEIVSERQVTEIECKEGTFDILQVNNALFRICKVAKLVAFNSNPTILLNVISCLLIRILW